LSGLQSRSCLPVALLGFRKAKFQFLQKLRHSKVPLPEGYEQYATPAYSCQEWGMK
jgi:hypothetical protein